MAFEELKERQSVMWGSAPFENYVHWLADMHDDLVERLAPKPGERWLDLATGTGEVAFRAAEAGAEVTASDLAPDLIETANRLAAERGLEIDFHVADCERLPYDEASFSQSSEDWWTTWKRSSSWNARSSSGFWSASSSSVRK